VAAQQPDLELGGLFRFDVRGCEPTKAGGDAVDGPSRGHNLLHEPKRRRHPRGNCRRHRHSGATVGDRDDVTDIERSPVDGYNPHGSSSSDHGQNTNYPGPSERDAAIVSRMQDLNAVRRSLKVVAASFAFGAIALTGAFALVDLGEPEGADLANGATLAATVLGVIGLLIALQWWSGAGEQPRSPASLQMGFIIRVAIAELGLLLGIVGIYMTGSITAALAGLGLFLVALLLLVLGVDKTPEV
jgi:hypothetical protein